MRNMFPVIAGLFFSGNVSAQLSTSNYDSLRLQQVLFKFKKHLDTAPSSPQQLLSLLETKNKVKQPVVADGTNQSVRYWEVPSKYFDNSKPLYSISQVIPLDTNHVLFIETEYDFKIRPTLRYLKDEYHKEKRPEYKANMLIDYIQLLNIHYPKQPDWDFSRSNTLSKYIQLFESTIKPLKRDTTKAYLYTTFADQLISMNPVYFRDYAFRYYLFAEMILLQPYTEKLKAGNILPNEYYGIYKEFLLTNPHAVALSNVYIQIYKALTPLSWFDKNNTLYPLDSKRKYYINQALYITKILDSNQKIDKHYLINYEKLLFTQTTNRYVKSNNRYSSGIFNEYYYLLENYISKLVTTKDTDLSVEHKKVFYQGLGDILYNLGEHEYALNAYYKSLENELNTKEPMVDDLETESLFYVTFNSMKELVKNNKTVEEKETFIRFFNLFKDSPINSLDINDVNYKSSNAVEITNVANALFLEGKIQEAKNTLLQAREKAIFDTTDNSQSITIFYNALNDNGWLNPIPVCITQLDRFDSLAYAEYHTDKESHFDGVTYIEQIFSGWNQAESDAYWIYITANLDDTINYKQAIVTEKEKTIDIINSKIGTANKKIEALNQTIGNKTAKIKSDSSLITLLTLEKNSLSNSVNTLKKDTAFLNSKIGELNTTATQLKQTNDNLKFWNTVLMPLAIVAGLASLVFFFITRKLKKIRSKLLNDILELTKSKSDLTVEKENLQYEVKGFKTTIELEREVSEVNLSIANNKIKTELTLKHEIKDILAGLHLSFESNIVKKAEIVTKEALEGFNSYFKKITSFSQYYYSLLQSDSFNTVDKEVELSKQYIDFKSMEQNTNDIVFSDKRKHTNLDISVPHHFINNFTMNSIKKGLIHGKKLLIEISDAVSNGVYVLTITDNGRGLPDKFSISDLPKQSTGLRNALIQTEYYNSQKNAPYTLSFNETSISNRIVTGESGTEVTLKFSKKNAI